jgi:hypothetical protein
VIALFWLKTTDGQSFMDNVDQLIFILGTNDINRVGAIKTVRHIGSTIEAVRHLYPGVNIVWQLLQQRTKKTSLLPEGQLVMNEIDKCNVLLLELAVTTFRYHSTRKRFASIYVWCSYDGNNY